MNKSMFNLESHFVDGVVGCDFGGGQGAAVHADAVDVSREKLAKPIPPAQALRKGCATSAPNPAQGLDIQYGEGATT